MPYLLQDLLALIDERMGKLENRASRMNYHRLMTRIETIRNDPRYDFMFENANVGGDTMAELLIQLFRLEPDGKPISVMQLAGLPAEVIDAVVCVLCRLAFDFGLWSDGAVPLLFVCEEAHRYASADQSVGFHPTRRALSRIAKEGRKYGVFLGLVTQRPAELDPTIISQCSTLFAMRMANDRDQALLRSAVSDDAANLLVLRALARHPRGDRLRRGRAAAGPHDVQDTAAGSLPRSEAFDAKETAFDRGERARFRPQPWSTAGAARRWDRRQKPDEVEPRARMARRAAASRARAASTIRRGYRLLKRPLEHAECRIIAGQARHAALSPASIRCRVSILKPVIDSAAGPSRRAHRRLAPRGPPQR